MCVRSARLAWLVVGVVAVGTAALLLPLRPVSACGGFFCNRPDSTTPLPVAQTAENVLFAMERSSTGGFKLEAHIQIFYTGPADKFSWVVPVDDKPALDIGHNRVFSALLGATPPQFTLNWRDEGTCLVPPSPFPSGPGRDGGFTSAAVDAAASAGDGPAGVTVAFRGDVGPFDAAVVRSMDPSDPTALKEWLRSNGYFISDEGSRLIDEYAREQKWFVALKLLSGRGTNEIQPIVLRFEGPGPCVPLKLTSIAALRDLRVNLWVLADARVVPDNYYEIKLNEARLDWFNGPRNYDDLIKRAADEAGGNAFVTEYAGTPRVLGGAIYVQGQLSLTGVRAARTPPEAMNAIQAAGFAGDAQLLNVLREHIPMPTVLQSMGLDERTFYNVLWLYYERYKQDFKPLDASALAADLDKKIVQPLVRAQALVDKHRKLTRLVTLISPEEMTIDPTFVMNPTLPDVSNLHRATAVRLCGGRYTACEAPVRLELADGRSILYNPRPGGTGCFGTRAFDYERGELDTMPALEIGWRRDSAGEGLVRFNNLTSIATILRAHNEAVTASPPPASQVSRDGGVAPAIDMRGAGGAAGSGGTAGAGGASGAMGQGSLPGPMRPNPTPDGGVSPTDGAPAAELSGGGCDCQLGGAGTPGAPLAILAIAALIARRRRR